MKIFITDLDGTLLNGEHQLDPKMREFILALRNQGHIFGVATGRPHESAELVVPEIESLFDFGVFNNGANFMDFKDGEQHDQYPLSKAVISEIMDVYTKLGGNPIIFKGQTLHTHHREDYHERLEQGGFEVVYGDIEPHLEDHMEKIIFSVNADTRNILLDHYANNPHDDYVAFRSQEDLIEFMDPRINKWVGVEYFLNKYNLEDYETISFGDNGNDLQLIQGASLGVAMENAIDELKDAADHVAGHHADLGVMNFIKDYLNKA